MLRTPSGLPLASRMVLAHLRKAEQNSDSSGGFFVYSMAECATDLSISPRTVSRSLGQLETAGLISFVPGKGQRPTKVQLHEPVQAELGGGDMQ